VSPCFVIAATDVRISANPLSTPHAMLSFCRGIFVNRLFGAQTGQAASKRGGDYRGPIRFPHFTLPLRPSRIRSYRKSSFLSVSSWIGGCVFQSLRRPRLFSVRDCPAALGRSRHWNARNRPAFDQPLRESATLALLVAGLSFAAYESRLVRHAFRNLRGAEVILFTEKVKAMTPPSAEMIVLGDDWNPRLVYYSQR
jgi:hypothetical protein